MLLTHDSHVTVYTQALFRLAVYIIQSHQPLSTLRPLLAYEALLLQRSWIL
jgi:hypothetical protein